MATGDELKRLVKQLSATYLNGPEATLSTIEPIEQLLLLPTAVRNTPQLAAWKNILQYLANASNDKALLATVTYSLLIVKDDKMNSRLSVDIELLVKIHRALEISSTDKDLNSCCTIFKALLLIIECVSKSMPLEDCHTAHIAAASFLQRLHKTYGSTTEHSVYTLTSYCLQYLSVTQATASASSLLKELPDGLIDTIQDYVFSLSLSVSILADPKGTRPRRNSENSHLDTSSESELSDPGSSLLNTQRAMSRIKCDALQLLHTYAKTQAKLLYPFWQQFLSNGPTPRSQNVLHLVYSDSSPSVRSGATAALIDILNGSRPFLAAADNRSSKAAFISFASSLGNIVCSLHAHILYVLRRPKAFRLSVMLNILKIANILIANVTYERLTIGLLGQLAAAVSDQLDTSDTQLKSSYLSLIGGILRAKPPDSELQSIAFSRNTRGSSLIDYALRMLSDDSTAATVKIESWRVVGNSFALDDGTTWTSSSMGDVLLSDSKSTLPAMQSAVASVAEQLCSATSSNGSFESRYAWWNFFINHIAPLLKDAPVAAKANVCNSISRLSPSEFKALDSISRTKMTALVLQFCQDAQPTVRASACRCIGCLVLLEDISLDDTVLEILVDSLMAHLSDKNTAVRVRASWSLGNIGDIMVRSRGRLLDRQHWLTLLTAAIKLSNASDKEGTNGVRALGCLIQVGGAEVLNSELVKRTIQACAHCAKNGSYKTQWNACHAIGNALRNEAFVSACAEQEMSCLLDTLIEAIASSNNFKVRINALASLCTVQSVPDEALRSYLACVRNAVLDTESDLQHLTFQEVRYEEPYKNALLDAYVHLVKLAKRNSLPDNLEHVSWFIDKYNIRSDVNRA